MPRDKSGQGHRPREGRARHGEIDNLGEIAESAAAIAGRQHTLAPAAALAIDALEILSGATAG